MSEACERCGQICYRGEWFSQNAETGDVFCSYECETGVVSIANVERLELRIAELIKERDEYDKRRREAIESSNWYRDELIRYKEHFGVIEVL